MVLRTFDPVEANICPEATAEAGPALDVPGFFARSNGFFVTSSLYGGLSIPPKGTQGKLEGKPQENRGKTGGNWAQKPRKL